MRGKFGNAVFAAGGFFGGLEANKWMGVMNSPCRRVFEISTNAVLRSAQGRGYANKYHLEIVNNEMLLQNSPNAEVELLQRGWRPFELRKYRDLWLGRSRDGGVWKTKQIVEISFIKGSTPSLLALSSSSSSSGSPLHLSPSPSPFLASPLSTGASFSWT